MQRHRVVLALAAQACSSSAPTPARVTTAAPATTSTAGHVADAGVAPSNVASFTHGALRLRVEALRDDLVHFELAPAAAPEPAQIATSPMIADAGAPIAWAKREGGVLETREVRVEVDAATLCAKVTDLARAVVLQRVCPADRAASLTITREGTQNVYGLGEQFSTPGVMDVDWIGRERTPGNEHGNAMRKFDTSPLDTGSVGNAQFPILYAAGAGRQSYAMFVDDHRAEQWSFKGDPWTLSSAGDALRWYVIAGPDLADLRRDFMALVGRAPVPPKPAFGLWISEYGFDDWKELEGKLASLRKHGFPVDGFVLDLQWFGGITEKSDNSRMGALTWDEKHFPDPAQTLARLRDKEGVGVVVIEESYVSRGLPEHADLAKRGCLARDCPTCPPTYITYNPWWGQGGMIDWSSDSCADYWHALKRRPLVDDGVLGHWCDLGEPEMFSAKSFYARGAHDEVHNLFTFYWLESIARGYANQGSMRRPFEMARSGAPGIQRFGASMWSGDIGSKLTSLATHLGVQANMSLSGIDYFGSDIGGFIREALAGDLRDTYTQWFADGMAIDVPGRVHTANVKNDRETAPDRVGHLASNLANVRRRYELVPYVYSLAHHAATTGDPVFPPLVWGFQSDPKARRIAHEKLIGPDVLVATVAADRAKTVDVYLPSGATWVELDGTKRHAGGTQLNAIPLRDKAGVLRLPMFVRAGAILPVALVDGKTMNTLGKRTDGSRDDTLRARIYPTLDATSSTRFSLVEDDGLSIAYTKGELRTTEIAQVSDPEGKHVMVMIEPARGSYKDAPQQRALVLDVVLDAKAVPRQVTLDGTALKRLANAAACDKAASGWCVTSPGHVRVKGAALDVGTRRAVIVAW